MRLKIKQDPVNTHTQLACAAAWSGSGELYTCSDDQTIQRWNPQGEPDAKVCSLETFFTELQWCSVGSKRQQGAVSDVFGLACTDGTFKIMTKSGRVEKNVDAHRGAVVCLRWDYEGSAIASGGEDGLVKIWSRSGMLRSTLAQLDCPCYSLAWGPRSDQVVCTQGPNLTIRSLQSSAKQSTWRAHEGVILKVDWSPNNGFIVSGGEDGKYKVWDAYGRQLYQSSAFDHSITSVAWSPTGTHFAVGTFNAIAICDQMGWVVSKSVTSTGSVLSISWTSDGTQLAGAGGSGAICFGQLVDRCVEDGRVQVNLVDSNQIVVQDLVNNYKEHLDFRERVVKMSLGYGHLVVVTSSQCQVYSTSQWGSPYMFDLKDLPHLIQQSPRNFLLVDNFTGLQIYTYEGRLVCTVKVPGLRTEFLNKQMVSISNDTLALMEQAGSSTVRFFDTALGKPIGDPLKHDLDVKELALSQGGPATTRQLLFIDRNRDLHLMHVMNQTVVKLAANVDSAVWHESAPMMAAIVGQQLVVWSYPAAALVDKDLTSQVRSTREDIDFGPGAQIQYFSGSKCHLRRHDGSQVLASTSPYPLMAFNLVQRGLWDKATRLCRFVKDTSVWACLAALALDSRELDTAEAAFAALQAVDKLRFVRHIKQQPLEEMKQAEMAMFRKQPQEAEKILIQAGLIYRVVKLHIRQFQWDRALEVAMKHQQHVDTVLWYRKRHLEAAEQQETLVRFKQVAREVVVDDAAVKDKIQQDKMSELQRRRS